ncbi:MAG: hypothetical protein ACR2NM_17310, partial [Bythopirellula sp.]
LRNLAATLKQIDWEAADESDLLKQAQQAHGSGSASKPMPMHKLQVLQGWIAQLTEAHHKQLTLMTLPLLAEEEPNPPPLQLNAPQQSVAQPKSDVRAASYEAQDPFDPAGFNDRYATQSKPAADPAILPVALRLDVVPHVLVPDQPAPIPLPEVE